MTIDEIIKGFEDMKKELSKTRNQARLFAAYLVDSVEYNLVINKESDVVKQAKELLGIGK